MQQGHGAARWGRGGFNIKIPIGGARAAQNPDKPRREAILALAKYADARQVYWRPNGGREGELSHRFFKLAMRMLNYNSMRLQSTRTIGFSTLFSMMFKLQKNRSVRRFGLCSL